MSSAVARPTEGYFAPTLYALLVHAALLLVMIGLPKTSEPAVFVQPKSIQAKLVELPITKSPQDRAKARPQTKAKAKPVDPPRPKPVEPKPVVASDPEPVREQLTSAPVEEAVDPGIDPALDDWLAEESSLLQADEELALVDSYAARIENQVYRQWSRPASARRDMELTLLIRLLPRGDIVSVTVLKSSGNEALDRSAVAAVSRVEQLGFVREMESDFFERYFREFEMLFKPDDLRL